MATIDRDKLLEDASLWLPNGNVLTDAQMLQIAEMVISIVGDDDSKYAEVLCKFLDAVANANIGKASVDSAGITKEKLGDHEITYGGTVDYVQVWKDFKDNLVNVCPLFGYSPKRGSGGGIRINASNTYNPLDR